MNAKTPLTIIVIFVVILMGIFCYWVTFENIEELEEKDIEISPPTMNNMLYILVIVLVCSFIISIILIIYGGKKDGKRGEG